MRKKFTDNKFFMPKQYELGTPQKDVTDAIETPQPLAKGYDGTPVFNELNKTQKENLKENMSDQVIYQSDALQNSNLQIINYKMAGFSSGTQAYVYKDFNGSTAFGAYLSDYVLFENYININYITVVSHTDPPVHIQPESYVSFYLMQDSITTPNGSAGMKIPRQIQAKRKSDTVSITLDGADQGAQSIAVPLSTQIFYNQADTMRGVRCKGLALNEIVMSLGASVDTSIIVLEVCLYVDKSTASQQL